MRLVHRGEATTRQDIADATGMSPSLVSRVTADLVRRGVLRTRSGRGSEGPGRPTERLDLHPDAGRTVGVQVARDRLAVLTCDVAGRPLDTWEEPNDAPGVTIDAVHRLAERIAAAARYDASAPPLVGVGAALHDVVSADGGWHVAGHEADAVPVRTVLAEHFDVPIVVDDVSRAFASAEHRFGAGRDAPDLLYLFLGRDGVGSGIFAGDAALRTATGICGEIGHVPVVNDGAPCSCGRRGCLETVATHRALLARARSLRDDDPTGEWQPGDGLHALLAATAEGDPLGRRLVEELADHLCAALDGAIAVTGATTVVLGGDVRASGGTLPGALARRLRGRLLRSLADRLQVRWAELPPTAGAHGMALAALDAAVDAGALIAAPRRKKEVAM